MRALDTNYLTYAADVHSPFHEASARFLDGLKDGPDIIYLTWGICYEFIRVVTHPSVLDSPLSLDEAWSFLEDLLRRPNFEILTPTPHHDGFLKRTTAELPHLRGNIVHDMHTAVLMREHDVEEIYSNDNDFLQFPFVTVINPLHPLRSHNITPIR